MSFQISVLNAGGSRTAYGVRYMSITDIEDSFTNGDQPILLEELLGSRGELVRRVGVPFTVTALCRVRLRRPWALLFINARRDALSLASECFLVSAGEDEVSVLVGDAVPGRDPVAQRFRLGRDRQSVV